MSRYLVTGSTGFLGRHLVRALRASGHDVVALVRSATDVPEGTAPVRGDVLDRASVEKAAMGCDGVFHCAGKVSRKPDDAEELHRLHVEGTKNVLDAAIAKNVRRAVIASTSGTIAVSDDPDHVANEDDEPPIGLVNRWPYYRSKLFAEKAAFERHGELMPNGTPFEVVSVNPTLLLGPGDVNGSSTDDVRLFLERRIPAIPPGGLSYVDVRDAAEGMRLAMERGIAGRRYLLGACNLTLREFFSRLERVSGVRGPIVTVPRIGQNGLGADIAKSGAQMLERLGARIGITMPVDPVSLDMAHFYWYLDASLAEEDLGWAPRDPTETLADTVKDLEERGVVWPDDPRGPSSLRVGGAASALFETASPILKRALSRSTDDPDRT
ncbi:MAG: NAD-dependent epimerase/dehydratase family protein [Deltaproteobacteria bacterium]|nr:NAD-dependent epimerase/dehydratase family protein [Deltaproteobacteria bacterium]